MSSSLRALYFLKSGGVYSRYGAFAPSLIDLFCNLVNFDNLDLYVINNYKIIDWSCNILEPMQIQYPV